MNNIPMQLRVLAVLLAGLATGIACAETGASDPAPAAAAPVGEAGVKGTVKQSAQSVKSGSKEAWQATKSGAHEAKTEIKSGAKQAWSATKEGAHEVKETVKGVFKGDSKSEGSK